LQTAWVIFKGCPAGHLEDGGSALSNELIQSVMGTSCGELPCWFRPRSSLPSGLFLTP
ncbi:UNVERIFIED_CONTAM: hypothetical protein K2H54_037860, partial [Gekko kuhli]